MGPRGREIAARGALLPHAPASCVARFPMTAEDSANCACARFNWSKFAVSSVLSSSNCFAKFCGLRVVTG